MENKIFSVGRVAALLLFTSFVSCSPQISGLSLKNIDKNWRAFLDETYVIDCKSKNARAEITYMFADIKFRDGALKICEFGEGKNSGVAMSDVLVNGNVEQMIKPYWNLFWVYLAHVGVPVWYVGEVPRKKTNVSPNDTTMRQALAWDQFVDMGGRYAQNLRSLERDHAFKQLSNQTKLIPCDDLSAYKGVIVYNYFHHRIKAHQMLLDAFKKKHPDFLVLDEASWMYGASKLELAKLLSSNSLASYKPKWKVYSKKYSPDLARRIIRDLDTKTVVIKPINSGRSNGIIFAEEKDLDQELKKILIQHRRKESSNKIKNSLGIMPIKTKMYDYWQLDQNDEFMVEAYEPSKKIKIDGKKYDPSMRVVFVARHDKGKIYVNILGAYWKIPHKSLSDKGTLTEKHKTVSVKQPGFTGILVQHEDLAKLKSIALEAFAKIYAKMIKVSASKKK